MRKASGQGSQLHSGQNLSGGRLTGLLPRTLRAARPLLPSGTDAPARNIPAGDFPDGGETDDGDGQDSAEREEQKLNAIIETGSVTKSNGKYTIHCLTIIGQIEGHYILPAQNKTTKYEHVIPQLVCH